MKRINTSRQGHAAAHRNCNYRPSGQIARHVIQATMNNETASKRFPGENVLRCRAHELVICGDVVVEVGQVFYLVASKFAPRYYVVALSKGTYQCSSKDAANLCINQVKAYCPPSRAKAIA